MFLGIDLGTSEIKVILLDRQHRIVASSTEPLSIQRPQPGWSEQIPGDWWAGLDRAMKRLALAHVREMAAVEAIGLSGQMHGAVLLGEADQVLRPAILWNDGRSQAQCAELEAAVPDLRTITGNMAMPGFTAPKLLWVRANEPEVFAKISMVLLPKDWLRLKLTGEKVSDMSDASGTLWLDVAARAWSPLLLRACGLTQAQMPRLAEGTSHAGSLRPECAAMWGMRPGIPVAGGAGDNAASALGMGAVAFGQGFISLGTSGVIFLCQDGYRPRADLAVHTYCHALPGAWHQMSVMLSAASSLSWACRLTGAANEAQLLERVRMLNEPDRRNAPLFLPYLDGERTPHNDARVRGALTGLSSSHGPQHIAYAVVEGVAFGLRDGWSCLGAAPGDLSHLALVGGGARSPWWAQLIATVLRIPIQTCEGAQAGSALGAARLAWLALGASVDDVCKPPAVIAAFDPDARDGEWLDSRYARFREAYPALAGLTP